MHYVEAAPALYPRYPAQDTTLDLATVNAAFTDRDDEYWMLAAKSLRRKFDQRVRECVCLGSVDHLFVFALAPQSLILLLGNVAWRYRSGRRIPATPRLRMRCSATSRARDSNRLANPRGLLLKSAAVICLFVCILGGAGQ
jgi:hypothetical protein